MSNSDTAVIYRGHYLKFQEYNKASSSKGLLSDQISLLVPTSGRLSFGLADMDYHKFMYRSIVLSVPHTSW